MTWPRGAAAGFALLTAVVMALGLALMPRAADVGEVLTDASLHLVALPAALLGLLVAARRPGNVVGALLVLAALGASLNGLTDQYVRALDRGAGTLPWPEEVVALTQGSWMWWFVPFALLALYFPDGRLPSPRWRPVAIALPLVGVTFVALAAFAPGPYMPPSEDVAHPWGTLPEGVAVVGAALPVVLLALLVAAATSLVRRRRRAQDDATRAQVRWLALAGMWLPGTLLLCWLSFATVGTADLVIVGLVGLYVSVPAATAVAILRHRLYDVDRAFSATVTYTVLGAALLAVYALAAVAGGLALGRGSAPAAAAATAVCALALAPLRTRLQRAVDRRVYPVRQAALAAVEDLRERTREGLERPEHLEARLRTALRDPRLRVAYRRPGADGLVDADGEPVAATDGVPVRLDGREIGALLGGSVSRELLREIADASALLVEVVGLRLEVGEALRTVESSRARLLRVGYEERRRLERDLHDGAQQRLVALGMSLRLAQRHLDDGTVDLDGLLDASVTELGTAVAELRQIANGLRPSCLDDGLGPALSSLTAGTPLRVALDVPDVADAGDDAVTTAYYVASEAVANAVKHADATRVEVGVERENGHLTIRVRDDGVGGATARPGSGLGGLADRVAAAGGTLHVRSAPGAGTTIAAELPCGS